MNNTTDLSKFGYRELRIAGQLLSALKTNNDHSNLSDGITVEFNPSSGNVFLVDEDYNVAMLNDDILEDWISCPECGYEDFKSAFIRDHEEKCCSEYANQIA